MGKKRIRLVNENPIQKKRLKTNKNLKAYRKEGLTVKEQQTHGRNAR